MVTENSVTKKDYIDINKMDISDFRIFLHKFIYPTNINMEKLLSILKNCTELDLKQDPIYYSYNKTIILKTNNTYDLYHIYYCITECLCNFVSDIQIFNIIYTNIHNYAKENQDKFKYILNHLVSKDDKLLYGGTNLLYNATILNEDTISIKL